MIPPAFGSQIKVWPFFGAADWKKIAQPKSGASCFTWQTKLRTSAHNPAFQLTLRDHSEKVRKEPGFGLGQGAAGGVCVCVCKKRPSSQNIRRLPLNKENQVSQVNEFSVFLCIGKCQSLGSLKSSLFFFLVPFQMCWKSLLSLQFPEHLLCAGWELRLV